MDYPMKTKTPDVEETGASVEAMKIRLYWGYRVSTRILKSISGTCFNGNLRRRKPLIW